MHDTHHGQRVVVVAEGGGISEELGGRDFDPSTEGWMSNDADKQTVTWLTRKEIKRRVCDDN
jgi:NAD-dependent SIR2 family protein deacetylase